MRQANMGGVVFLNGNFLPARAAKLPVTSCGLLYGWGCFETMRSYGGKIVYLDSHLLRIRNSCEAVKINLPYPLKKLKDYIWETAKINGFKDACVRLTLWKNQGKKTDASIFVKKYTPPADKKYKKGFSCSLSNVRVNEAGLLTGLKTTNYLSCRLAYLEAQDRGFDEAIMLNSRGYIAEGARSNIFFIKKNGIFTPSLECGCLPGITRKVVFDLAKKFGLKVCEDKFTLSEVFLADEAFLTNSLMGIMPLAGIDKTAIGRRPFELTGFLMKHYNKLLINGIKKD